MTDSPLMSESSRSPQGELPEIGQWIRYRTKTAKRGRIESIERIGRVTCIWGNGWDGAYIDTTEERGCCIPALGDTWEVLDDR